MAFQLLSLALVATTALAAPVASTQSAYGQCGGQNWSGPTSCVAGFYCQSNGIWYSQCIPGTSSTAAPGSSSKASVPVSSTKATTPISSTTKPVSSPVSTPTSPVSTITSASSPATTAAVSGNPFAGKQMYVNSFYASEVNNLAIPSLASSLIPAASQVAKTPSFYWMDVHAKVPTMGTMLDDIAAKNKAGASPPNIGIFVVYDLPDRDCAAYSSNGEYSIANNGVANYKSYIDDIAAQLKNHSSTDVVLVIEPDSLGNLITNLNVAKCSNAQSAYLECYNYALTHLNLPNVAMYIDAGHAGWLGWSANIGPAAQLFGSIYKNAGSPAAVRGLATNVANYNAFSIATCPSYTQGDANCDEQKYVNALAPLLTAAGFPAHFIMDTSRNGVQPTSQLAWGDWCNVKGTGFGARPTTNTGDPLEDAFVWVKPGAESDGTSDSTAARYDSHCGLADALQPAPQAGSWFQAYFVQLLTNANPAFT
ncbi:hypothetical protein LTR62_004572 [Meristemomyces frigidus]|uniref:Glucanase n=1 Tax=Meristemomyces frigidus TaxID=1508187 RepID=A0AAN7TLZ8_9PEZI|nr:hypothetical protein LTR62_004572 [Meristemomyces frigidus]